MRPTQFVLFTGEGGVGKTTVAAATAVALADEGLHVLLLLGDVIDSDAGNNALDLIVVEPVLVLPMRSGSPSG